MYLNCRPSRKYTIWKQIFKNEFSNSFFYVQNSIMGTVNDAQMNKAWILPSWSFLLTNEQKRYTQISALLAECKSVLVKI